ncbi:hypothetical protein NUV66_06425 [Pseudomonas sp. 32.2.56]|jgi:hypothetical protein|uniref:hypothetical protein n=1 Tax=Pseudomonadaceae TaxID=135621 RepID=UPI001F244E0A|nr:MULTISPECIES: hypothetical protein [Pseudomonas]MCR4508935.1 hypothetical protein [Pseudomonas sp. 32.2.56]
MEQLRKCEQGQTAQANTAQKHPTESELVAAGLSYPVSKEQAVLLWYEGFRSEPIPVLEAWEAIGHDIGCNPSKQELLDSLRNMAAICEAHGNDMPKPAQHAERQQAVHWRAVLDPAEVPMQLNPHEHIAGFTDRRKAEDWIAARLCMDGWHYTLEPLYATLPPAQDVRGLVEALEAIVRQYPNPDITHVDYRVQACKQAEHALEAYRATLAAQGAAGA